MWVPTFVIAVFAARTLPGALAFGGLVPNHAAANAMQFQLDTRSTHVSNRKRIVLFSSNTQDKDVLLEELRAMRVKELKAELDQRRISTADAFEKEELVQRLYRAKRNAPTSSATKTPATPNTPGTIVGDLSFTAVETGRSIEGNLRDNTSVRIQAEGNPYPTIVLDVDSKDAGGRETFQLTLLLDTACSGLVLRPSVANRYPKSLPSVASPVTMTGAGGQASGMSVTQLPSYSFGSSSSRQMGPLVAAIQDIGALPLELDGILGLTFLSQYACSEFDLENSKLVLYKDDFRPPLEAYGAVQTLPEAVGEGELSPTKLGIWTVDVSFWVGGVQRKPIKMLVDTGATSTFLSWKGLQNMGLDRSMREVEELKTSMGAMGSDNVAMSLTHRIEVDVNRPISFGRSTSNKYSGLLVEGSSIPIDIGNIAILDTQLAADNVAGILGMDVLSKASRLRMVVRGPIPRITLYQNIPSSTTQTTTESTNHSEPDSTIQDSTSSSATPVELPAREQVATHVPTTQSVPEAEGTESPRKKKKKKRRYESEE